MNKPFHNIPGLTEPEYQQLRDELHEPRLYWPPLIRSDLRRALASALHHTNLFLKVEQVIKAASSPEAYASPMARVLAMSLRNALETRNLYLMRDIPSKGAMQWSKNKARLAFWLDNRLEDIVSAEFMDDAEMLARVAKVVRRWTSKRLPGMGHRLKPGPKTGKRKRLHKRKENTNESTHD